MFTHGSGQTIIIHKFTQMLASENRFLMIFDGPPRDTPAAPVVACPGTKLADGGIWTHIWEHLRIG